MAELNVGDKAPDFDLPTDGAGRITLAELKGQSLVLYFYPKDDTSGCTSEAKAFSEMRNAFDEAGAMVLGVSKDSPSSHDKFKGWSATASGSKRTCTAANTWGSSAPPS
jgi:peroxiredoxin Q/BCP